MKRTLLVTGGLGFIGSAVCLWAGDYYDEVICVDNRYRSGVDINVPLLESAGVTVVCGDIREAETWGGISGADAIVHCASEPAVAEIENPISWYSAEVNIMGTLRMLDWAAERVNQIILLSTSRVYSLRELRSLDFEEGATRFVPSAQSVQGFSRNGISTRFSTRFPGSLYGASKLSAEALVENWAYEVGASATINRCGVVTGAGQFGNSNQGFFKHFVESCRNREVVSLRGFGGLGKQVRDILFIQDLLSLLKIQLLDCDVMESSGIWNVSGGIENSVSLKELIVLLERETGQKMEVLNSPETSSFDAAWLVLDSRATQDKFKWKPLFDIQAIVENIWSAT